MEQSLALLQAPQQKDLKGKRDRALLALLLACGLRRHEAVGLRLEHWNNGRNTGPLSICRVKQDTFAPFRSPVG